MQASCEPHFIPAKRIFLYLQWTINVGLHYVKSSLATIIGYCDGDWAGSRDDRRLTIGFITFIGPNLISWGAKKQATILRSIVEVEYRSFASTIVELIWYANFFNSLDHSNPIPTLNCDNKSTINISKNHIFHHRTKHIEIDVHFIRKQFTRGVIKLVHCYKGVKHFVDSWL